MTDLRRFLTCIIFSIPSFPFSVKDENYKLLIYRFLLLTQERISFHRQQLKQRLGLTAQGKVFSTGVDQLFDDSDLLIQSTYSPSAPDSTAKKKVDLYIYIYIHVATCMDRKFQHPHPSP